jgi:hypothetical protein
MKSAGPMTKHLQLLATLVATEMVRPLLVRLDAAGRIFSIAFFAIVGIAVFRTVFDTGDGGASVPLSPVLPSPSISHSSYVLRQCARPSKYYRISRPPYSLRSYSR